MKTEVHLHLVKIWSYESNKCKQELNIISILSYNQTL